MKRARGCWVRGRGAGTAPNARMAASLLYYTAPHTCGSAGLVGHGESAPAAWLGSEAVFPGTQKARMRGEGDRDKDAGEGREEKGQGAGTGAGSRQSRALVRVRAADKAGGCQGDGGRRTHPGTRGRRGAASARQAYLNISLCHTRGAADNFITSADKNDCGRMQMARPSRCLPPLRRRLRAGAQRRAPRPTPRAGPTSPLCPRPCAAPPEPRWPVGLGKERGGGGRELLIYFDLLVNVKKMPCFLTVVELTCENARKKDYLCMGFLSLNPGKRRLDLIGFQPLRPR